MSDERITKLPVWAQSLISELRQDLAHARALTDLDTAVPERMPVPPSGSGHCGWDFNAYQQGRVYPCWTTNVYHYKDRTTPPSGPSIGSQRGVALYATRADALRALRAAKVAEYAKVLAGIDREIAKETDAP